MLRLKKELRSRLKGARKIAVMGIGSPLRGDDAAGPLFIKELEDAIKEAKKTLPAKSRTVPRSGTGARIKLISCETVPENYTGDIRKFNPTHVIIVDAVDMGKEPGWADIVDLEERSEQVSFSTHRLPINMFIEYLKQYLNCQVITIGIQPKSIDFSSPLSDKVREAVKQVSDSVLRGLSI